jgi:2-methylcitrate dehydratase PrpD
MSTANKADHDYGVAPLRLDVSRDFCAFAASATYEDLPARVVAEARRGILDWIGCALAGSRHATIDKVLAGLARIGSLERVPVIGRGRKLGLLEAAQANGQIGHVLDFDDTHMDGVILHTSSPTLAALFSATETGPYSGRDLILAYVMAFEAGVRVGKATPGHHDGGWHLTGTLGSIAAGVAVAKLLRLDAKRMNYALGLATTQASGMQQNRGTMTKSFHAGRAASSGVLAGFLASEGVDSSDEIIEGKKGFARIYSAAAANPEALREGLGTDWQIVRNGYKPYACGIVLHPLIDGMIELGRQGIAPSHIAAVELVVNPAAVRITGVGDPKTGLQSKFSIYHSAAVAFLDRQAGLAQYSDARAVAPEVVALREKVSVSTDDRFGRDEARARIIDVDGKTHEVHVPHASGTTANPMSDAAVEGKFLGNAVPVIGDERAHEIAKAVWSLEKLGDARDLVRMCG